MILNFGAKNFFSFKEGVNISLELGANCPENVSQGQAVSNLLCIEGANGSGKTNLIKIMSYFKNFCCNSWDQKPDDDIHICSFFNNNNPIDIYCEFISNNVTYLYEASLTSKKVLKETLSRKKKRLTILFERQDNKLSQCIKEFSSLKHIKLRSNASIISTSNQYEIKKTAGIYAFFSRIYSNVKWSGRYDLTRNVEGISRYYKNNPKVLEKAKEFMVKSDIGIKEIEIKERKDENGKTVYFPTFYHDAEVDNNFLTYYDQSGGTKTLFKTLPFYIFTLNFGGVLAMDELDEDLHPHIIPKLIDLFEDKSINTNNAQLIFSTHNIEVMDRLGKYRTFLVNKEKSESYGYRLDEIPGELIRNDRLISPIYNRGKIGGVPSL